MRYCPGCGIYFEQQLSNVSYSNHKCNGCGFMFEIKEITPVTFSEVVSMVQTAQMIPAIKRLRGEFGWGLRESKQVVDVIKAAVDGKSIRINYDY